MDFKASFFARMKKPLPCFLCNGAVKNHENICKKCKKTVVFQSPSPVPKPTKKQSDHENSKFFYLKSTNSNNSQNLLKLTPSFTKVFSHNTNNSYIKQKSPQKDTSIEDLKNLIRSKRQKSSFDLNFELKPSSSKHRKRKSKDLEKFKYYRISKSPVPEIRPSSINKILDAYQNSSIEESNVYDGHYNTLTSITYLNKKIWTVGLDYKLKSWDSRDMSQLSSITAHSRGVVAVDCYNSQLVTCAKDGKLKIWNNNCAHQVQAHPGVVKALEVHSNYIITANNSIKLWQGFKVVQEYPEGGIVSLCSFNKSGFLSGTKTAVYLWDVRAKYAVSKFVGPGPFLKCMAWDECSFWTGSDTQATVIYTQKWDIRTCAVVQTHTTGLISGLCKVNNKLVTAGSGITVEGKQISEGLFSCAKYFKNLNLLCAGDRSGYLHVIRTF
jgi:WD domain, G-beta repeat